MEKRSTGFLIAIEGIDGSGKSTLANILKERLTSIGFDVLFLPSGGFNSLEIEAQLRKIVVDENSKVTQNTETFIYFASLSQKVEQYIIPALAANNVVIVDRFSLSTFVFAHYMLKQDRCLIERMLRFATQELVPDFTFLCDLNVSVAYSRLLNRGAKLSRREKQGTSLMTIMREGYLKEIAHASKQYEIINTDKVSIENLWRYSDELEQYL